MTPPRADVMGGAPGPTAPPAAAGRSADGGDQSAPVFPGASEMAARCRAFDWAATPLGPADAWPVSLRTTVALLLAARHPMILFWGPQRVQLYNDAYIPALGGADRHPAALGVRAQAFWTGAMWDLVGPQLAHVLATGEATWHEDQEVALPRGGGTEQTYWTYSYTPAADDAGRVAGVLVIAQETTARVRGERALRTAGAALGRERARLADVFRQSPAFLAVLRGPTHVFELVNDAYAVLVGHRALLGKPVGEALPEAQAQGFVALLDDVLATGTPFVGREVPITLARGATPGHAAGGAPEERFVDFVYLPLVEADGAGQATRVGVIAHGSDVTAQVLARREVERLLAASEATRAGAEAARADAEQARERADAERERADVERERATEANRVKGEFLAVMSHELRTPLNAIGGYAELIELGIRGPVTPEQCTDLAKIQRSQRHLLGLINGVLNYARVEAGAVQYDVADVPLDEVLATAEALTAPQVRAKGLTLAYGGCAPALRVRADREKLQQVVLNLLSNAVKFTEPGGRLALRCAADGAAVRIAVADTGIGIAADQLARVFEPFVQVDARLTRTREGTGLGLAISRDLARGMGGDLTAESAPGVGSTFTLTLPAA